MWEGNLDPTSSIQKVLLSLQHLTLEIGNFEAIDQSSQKGSRVWMVVHDEVKQREHDVGVRSGVDNSWHNCRRSPGEIWFLGPTSLQNSATERHSGPREDSQCYSQPPKVRLVLSLVRFLKEMTRESMTYYSHTCKFFCICAVLRFEHIVSRGCTPQSWSWD